MERTRVGVWTDPACPWAWQVAKWLIGLRDHGLVHLRWRIFSLEVNTAGADTPFRQAAARYGDALVALALARRQGGDDAFERVYVSMATRLHDRGEEISNDLVHEAIREAALETILGDTGDVEAEIVDEHRRARATDVFGVPTLELDDGKPIYGPIIPRAPEGDEALALWDHVRWLASRPDFFELKRWPRDVRPAHATDVG